MSEPDPVRHDEVRAALEAVGRRLRAITVATIVLVLAVCWLAAGVYADLINYFAGEAMLYGGTSIGAILLGFAAGWFARGRR